MSIRRATFVLACLALLVPAGASAATPSSAQRFADAALRLKIAVKANKDQIAAGLDEANLVACTRALERKPPQRAVDRAVVVLTMAMVRPLIDGMIEPVRQMVRDLHAIPTSDPALRSGRAAWRASLGAYERMPHLDRPCEAMERWADARWRASAAPKISTKALDELFEDAEAFEAKVERAAARLRRLGVSKGAAERFTGESLGDDVLPEDPFDDLFAGEAQPLR